MEKMVLSVGEAAQALGVGVNLAYDLVRQGVLPSIRLGAKRIVVPRAALEEFIRESALRRVSA